MAGGASGASIRLRTGLKDGVLTVRALIRHPMEVGRRPAHGPQIPSHFITRVVCELNGETVFDADWGGGIASNPYLSFTVDGAQEGEAFPLRWVDNRDGSDTLSVQL